MFVCTLVTAFGSAAEPPLRVVTLHTVLSEIAREVGGDRVVVTSPVQPGIDPHAFDPSARDLRTMQESDLVLASGLKLEPYLDRILANISGNVRVVRVGDALTNSLSATADDGHAEKDPHWWNSIACVAAATNLVRDECTKLRPNDAAGFARRADAYRARLDALRAWATAKVAELPPERRRLVTSHEAFGYLARDFGFTIHSINGLSPDAEASARTLAGLVEFVRREHVRAIFAESSASPRLVENLIADTGVRRGGTLYADGLGPVGGDAATYEQMYRHNLETIVDALK